MEGIMKSEPGNKIEHALHELTAMDELAAGSSFVHGLHPGAKLAAAVFYILVVLSFHKYDLAGLIPMVLWPVLLFAFAGIPVSTCFYKLRIVLPLVMAVGLFNPFFDHTPVFRLGGTVITGGVISMITLMLKGVFCLMSSFLLAATTPIDSICAALRKIHVPEMLVTLLLLTYRYVGVLTSELAVMTDAYHLRAPGQKGIHISAWGSFLGQLLLRSMDRAQRLYESMLLRGYDGRFHYAVRTKFEIRDAIYLAASAAFFLLVRYGHAAELVGSFIVRG